MIHIKRITIVDNTIEQGADVLKKGFGFDCSEVNLLVGEQGCGKSTLLKMIQKNSKSLEMELAEHVITEGIQSYYFDTEKDNPRVRAPELYTTVSGEDKGIGFKNALRSRFKSHGEIMKEMVVEPMKTAKDCVIILDEPESGLSITNQYKLIENIRGAVKRNCQIFIATHCYPLILAFDYKVISLEHFETMKGFDFIGKVAK